MLRLGSHSRSDAPFSREVEARELEEANRRILALDIKVDALTLRVRQGDVTHFRHEKQKKAH